MQSRRLTAAALCGADGLVLSACTVGPDYTPPRPRTPDAFRAQEEPNATSPVAPRAPIDTAWWETLGDPELTGLIRRAVEGNNDLALATERIVQARASRTIAAAAGLPMVDSSAAYSRSRQSENTFGPGFGRDTGDGHDLYSVGLDASWEIDVFGGIRRSVEAAERDIQALEENRRAVFVALAAEVARNYVDLRGFQQRMIVTQRNIQTQADTLGLTESRFRAGLTSELDVAQARAQLENTRASLPPLDEAARAAMHRIGVLLGQEAGSVVDELGAVKPIPAPPGRVPIGLPSDLVQRRPDIRRAERQLAAQTSRIGVAVSDLFPRFSLTGDFGLEAGRIGNVPEGDSLFWSIGPAVRWPIFRGGSIRANIRQQESLARQALITYDQTLLTAFEDVENALVSYSRAQQRREALAAAVAADRRSVELSTTLNRAGLVDFQRVLDSQRSLAVSEEQLSASDQAVVQALIRLYTALGGGWEGWEQPPAGPPPPPVSAGGPSPEPPPPARP